MTGFRSFSTSVIASLEEVRLYDETAYEHVPESHPEISYYGLPSMIYAVGRAIENPTHVENSYGNSLVFVDRNTTNQSGDPLRVPVKILVGTRFGRVKSFYFAETNKTTSIIFPVEEDRS